MKSNYSAEAAASAASAIRARIGSLSPSVAIILGSGLGGLATRIVDAKRIGFADIPGFPVATVAGHDGAVIGGSLGDRRVLALSGRF
ncbi:MAG TPA: purine-nucleoside phosphorylase, partial [Gemmatimonadaceae bacterium]|nr:purine-nucleoside phosphorylase [Gemmatimonadaceae bacterium]